MVLVTLPCIGIGQDDAVPAHCSEQRVDEREIWLSRLTMVGKPIEVWIFGSFHQQPGGVMSFEIFGVPRFNFLGVRIWWQGTRLAFSLGALGRWG